MWRQFMSWKPSSPFVYPECHPTSRNCLCTFAVDKAMAPLSSTLAWKIPWTEEPGGLQSTGSLRVGHDEWLHFHFSLSCIGEGNGNPLQYSCLESPRDGGAWWAAVYGVTQSRTRLKRLSSSFQLLIPKLLMYPFLTFSFNNRNFSLCLWVCFFL